MDDTLDQLYFPQFYKDRNRVIDLTSVEVEVNTNDDQEDTLTWENSDGLVPGAQDTPAVESREEDDISDEDDTSEEDDSPREENVSKKKGAAGRLHQESRGR